MKSRNKFLLILKFLGIYIVTPLLLTLLTSAYFLNNLNSKSVAVSKLVTDNNNIDSVQGIQVIKQEPYLSLEYKDYRAFVLDKYFALHNSPLTGYGSYFVTACDQYGAPKDCTIVAAIAYVETKLCTQGLSLAQYNCWGWGGSNENRVLFKSFPDAIDTVTKKLVSGYASVINNPEAMQRTYCGPNCTSWGTSVIRERNRINNLSRGFNLPAMF